MISKESEYLVHAAEEQLERLNKAIYYYEKNSEVENDILSSSLSLNHSNNFKCSSSNNANSNRNNMILKNELKPVYKIIKRQRDESLYSSSKKKREIDKQKQYIGISKSYDTTDHIRDWRNGVNLVKQTLGPQYKCHKCSFNKNHSMSPTPAKKKERVSTFWDDQGDKRNPKLFSKDASHSEKSMHNRCSKRNFDREEIQKYIKHKQKLAKEKRCEDEMIVKLRQDNIRSSLNNLQNHHDKNLQSSRLKNVKSQNDPYFMQKSSSLMSLQKPKTPVAVYDELKNDGLLEYIDLGNYDHPYTSTMPTKYKNGLNSTVDSGIDTGDWHQSLTPEKFRKSYDRNDDPKWSLPPPPPSLSKSTSQTDIRREKYYPSSKTNDRFVQTYHEQISAYDASSENEIVVESDGKLSSASSTVSAEFIKQQHVSYNLSRKKTDLNLTSNLLDRPDSRSSESTVKRKHKRSDINNDEQDMDSINRNSCGDYQAQALKEALYNAQISLNLENKESGEVVSEKISKAVQNFIKNKESNASTRTPSCLSPQSFGSPYPTTHFYANNDSKSKVASKMDSNVLRTSGKKDQSTELEATEMEFEVMRNSILTQDANLPRENMEMMKVTEERRGDTLEDDTILKDFDLNDKLPNLNAFKTDLLYREGRANEVIKLSKDLQKESKRISLLEKKAIEISKSFIPNSLRNHRHSSVRDNTIGDDVSNLSKFGRPLPSSDLMEMPKNDEYQKTTKMVNSQSNPLGKITESPLLGMENKGIQSQSSQSENDEITISISEMTTTLTDQSELEARILALQCEIEKKKQIVSNLKKRQKDVKREKIIQKETVLQKQIEMYDNHINKLQESIDQLNSKIDDNNSDDSHTLTESIANHHDLDSKLKQSNKGDGQDGDGLPRDEIDNRNHHGSNITINLLDDSKIIYDEQNKLNPDSRQSSLNCLVESNELFAANDVDMDTLLQGNFPNEDVKENEFLNNKIDLDSLIDVSLPNIVEYRDPKDLFSGDAQGSLKPKAKEKSYDISVNLEIGDCTKDNLLEENLIAFDKDDLSFNLDNLIQANIADFECADDTLSEHLDSQEFDSENGDVDAIFDSLVSINKEPQALFDFRESVTTLVPVVEDVKSESFEPENEPEKRKPQTIETDQEVPNDEKEKLPQDNISSPPRSPKLIKLDPHADSDVNSDSSSVKSKCSVNNISKPFEQKSENVFVEDDILIRADIENQIHYAETISDGRSSVSDIDSIINFIEEDSLEDPNAHRLSPRTMENDLISAEDVLQVVPTVKSCQSPDLEDVEKLTEVERVNRLPNEYLHSAKIEEYVDTLFNTIILNEIENLKPVLADFRLEEPEPFTGITILDFDSASPIGENLEILSPIIEKNAITSNILKSEDIWEFSDLNIEDPWKIEDAISIIENNVDVGVKIDPVENVLDKKLLIEKISWLIPLKPEYIEPLIESATRHVYDYRSNHPGISAQALTDSQHNLPHLFSNNEPIVTDSEIISALFDTSIQQPYIDKRIIFQLVLEAFLEIYSLEKYLPQPSWVHSSVMVKSNVHSIWKGETPPESYDLVRKIIFEHVNALLNQKNIVLPGNQSNPQQCKGQPKLIKWCIRQQKDDVDKLLINDLRKEENEWIYYDAAEEEVQFQIAEDIFQFLMLDTVLWFKSMSDNNN